MIRPTKSQLKVLRLMASGWELGKDNSMIGRWWMQEGGLGRGGEAKDVHARTPYNLRKKVLIQRPKNTPQFPPEYYRLCEIGRKAL